MQIKLRLKHRQTGGKSLRAKDGGNGVKKRPGYQKGKYGRGTNHTPYVMVLQANGKRTFLPASEVV